MKTGEQTDFKALAARYDAPEGGERYYTNKSGRHPLDGAYRRLFAYVPQGNALMSGTIREIVSFAEPDADTEARLLQNLRRMTDKTVVIVTHRAAASPPWRSRTQA